MPSFERSADRKWIPHPTDPNKVLEIVQIIREVDKADLEKIKTELVKQRDAAQTQVDINNALILKLDDLEADPAKEVVLEQTWKDVEAEAHSKAEMKKLDMKAKKMP